MIGSYSPMQLPELQRVTLDTVLTRFTESEFVSTSDLDMHALQDLERVGLLRWSPQTGEQLTANGYRLATQLRAVAS